MRSHLFLCASVIGLAVVSSHSVLAQTTTNNIDAPNNATSTANPAVDLNQNGSLVNTQINNNPLGRSIVGRGIADCTSSGIAVSAFGNGIGPFDSGSLGGSLTYTQSFGVQTCKDYAQTQLSKAKLENCLLLISNYSKMVKAGVKVSYQALKSIGGVDCPPVVVQSAVVPTNGPIGQSNVVPAQHQSPPLAQEQEQQRLSPNRQHNPQHQNPNLHQQQQNLRKRVPVATSSQ